MVAGTQGTRTRGMEGGRATIVEAIAERADSNVAITRGPSDTPIALANRPLPRGLSARRDGRVRSIGATIAPPLRRFRLAARSGEDRRSHPRTPRAPVEGDRINDPSRSERCSERRRSQRRARPRGQVRSARSRSPSECAPAGRVLNVHYCCHTVPYPLLRVTVLHAARTIVRTRRGELRVAVGPLLNCRGMMPRPDPRAVSVGDPPGAYGAPGGPWFVRAKSLRSA